MAAFFHYDMPLLREHGKPLDLKVTWYSKIFVVERLLRESKRSIVLVVRYSDEKRRIIKLYPLPLKTHFFLYFFRSETRAYRKLHSTSCPVVPRYYGSCVSTTLVYPPDCNIPESSRLCGKQNAVMLEYIEGEDITPDNFTPAIGQKILDALKILHNIPMTHNDFCDWGNLGNVMLTNKGEVKWIDFELSLMDEDLRDGLVEREWSLAVEMLEPGGHMHRYSMGLNMDVAGIIRKKRRLAGLDPPEGDASLTA